MRGVLFQEAMERRAAQFGGGNLVAPVQRVTDFIEGKAILEGSQPSSSYRMGVKAAACHEIYPPFITEALRKALRHFDKEMPGFVSEEALLHGVETRTSAPVQITRSADSLECVSLRGLFPAGEGAGYAGGIVSAAVDGMAVGTKVALPNNLLTVAGQSVIMSEVEFSYDSPVDYFVPKAVTFSKVFFLRPRKSDTVTKTS
jgi:uncharacterized FAD-dependent dehydrogenase